MRNVLKRLSAALLLLLAALLLSVPALAADRNGDSAQSQETSGVETEAEKEPGIWGSVIGGGTTILIGAGVYTYVRGRISQKKEPQEFVHFENHSRPYDPETGKFGGN